MAYMAQNILIPVIRILFQNSLHLVLLSILAIVNFLWSFEYTMILYSDTDFKHSVLFTCNVYILLLINSYSLFIIKEILLIL